MKKVGLLLLAVLVLFSMTACAKLAPVSDTELTVALREALTEEAAAKLLETYRESSQDLEVTIFEVKETEEGYAVSGRISADFLTGHRLNRFEAVCARSGEEYRVEALDLTAESGSLIDFPGLGIHTDPPRTLPFSVFGKEIYLYGVVIAFGFVLAIVYARLRCKEFGVSFDSVTEAIIYCVPLAIICARIYYVAFSWDEYKDNLADVFKIWEGGIAIYGGVIGAALGLILFSRIRKKKIAPYLDIMGLGLLIGQLIGRWGNYFNREAHGAETAKNFFLRMYMYSSQDHRFGNWHPTFLYESVWNLLGFILLHFLSKKRKYDGQVFLMYVAWYGLGRVWIEGLRTDSLWIGSFRASQLLAGLSVLIAVGIMVWIRIKKHPDGSGLQVHVAPDEPAERQETSES